MRTRVTQRAHRLTVVAVGRHVRKAAVRALEHARGGHVGVLRKVAGHCRLLPGGLLKVGGKGAARSDERVRVHAHGLGQDSRCAGIALAHGRVHGGAARGPGRGRRADHRRADAGDVGAAGGKEVRHAAVAAREAVAGRALVARGGQQRRALRRHLGKLGAGALHVQVREEAAAGPALKEALVLLRPAPAHRHHLRHRLGLGQLSRKGVHPVLNEPALDARDPFKSKVSPFPPKTTPAPRAQLLERTECPM